MVRKGSSVRVRQRAFRCARRSGATSRTSVLSFRADAWPPPGAARPNLNRSDTTLAAGRSGTAVQTDDRAAAPLVAILGVAGLARYGQPAQETSPGRLVVTRGGRNKRDRPAGVQLQIARIAEYRRGDRAVDMGVERRDRRGFEHVVGELSVDKPRYVRKVQLHHESTSQSCPSDSGAGCDSSPPS